MSTSIILRSLTRRGLTASSSSFCCKSVTSGGDVKTPLTSWIRKFRSEPDENNISSPENEAKTNTNVTNPTKLVFNFKCCYDNRKHVKKHQIPKIIESPNGDMTFVTTKTLKETMYDIICRNVDFSERARGLKVTKLAVLVPPYINEYQKQIIREAAIDAGTFVERFVEDHTENPFPNGTDADKGGFGIVIDLVEVFDVPIREFILSGDKSVLETILSVIKKIRGYDLKKDPLVLQKLKEAVDRATTKMASSNFKKPGIRLIIPAAAGQPEESALITWTKD